MFNLLSLAANVSASSSRMAVGIAGAATLTQGNAVILAYYAQTLLDATSGAATDTQRLAHLRAGRQARRTRTCCR